MVTKAFEYQAFAGLISGYAPMVDSYLSALTGSRSHGDELVAKVFDRAQKAFESFGKKESDLGSWLRTIAKKLIIEQSQEKRFVIVADKHVLTGIEAVFLAIDEQGAGDTWIKRATILQPCYDELSEELREACNKYYLESTSLASIAEDLGVDLADIMHKIESAQSNLTRLADTVLGLEPPEIKDSETLEIQNKENEGRTKAIEGLLFTDFGRLTDSEKISERMVRELSLRDGLEKRTVAIAKEEQKAVVSSTVWKLLLLAVLSIIAITAWFIFFNQM